MDQYAVYVCTWYYVRFCSNNDDLSLCVLERFNLIHVLRTKTYSGSHYSYERSTQSIEKGSPLKYTYIVVVRPIYLGERKTKKNTQEY